MIKQTKVNFNLGLSPALETLEKKWGTPDATKAADKIQKIVIEYKKLLVGLKAGKKGPDGAGGLERGATAWETPKKTATKILEDMSKLATKAKNGGPKP